MNFDKICSAIDAYQARTTAPFGVVFCDLASGKKYARSGERVFPMASVYKIFLLAEVFRQVKCGTLDLAERITVTREMFTRGSGMIKEFAPPVSLTLADCVYLMIAYSDNTATDIVLDRVGLDNVRRNVLEAFGFADTRIDLNCRELLDLVFLPRTPEIRYDKVREPRDNAFFRCESERNQSSTPNSLARALELIYRGELPDAESSVRVLETLKKCATNSRISARLPNGVPVAHKTGSLDRLANDAGIVFTAKGDYVLVMLYNGNLADEKEYRNDERHRFANDLMSCLSREVYDAYLEE